jgi:hypothetical protein
MRSFFSEAKNKINQYNLDSRVKAGYKRRKDMMKRTDTVTSNAMN